MALVGASAQVEIRDILDINGQPLRPFKPVGHANVLFFIATDCPISNTYAPEIQRICSDYGSKGVGCALLYEDVDAREADVRKHRDDYRYRGIPAAIDSDRKLAEQTRASVTPQAVVIDRRGDVRYRGRIDNRYAALGKPRQQVTVHDLTDALDAVLAGKSVSNPETTALGCHIVPPDVMRKSR